MRSARAFRSLALTKDIKVNEFQRIYSYLAVRIHRLHKATILLAMLMGIAAPSQVHSDPSLVGEWSPLTPLPPVTLHMSVLPNGKLIIWPRTNAGSKAYLWDVAANTKTLLPSVQTNIFCSGHTVLADGRLFVAGGHAGPTSALEGAKETHIFDPVNNTWQQVADMNAGRWYPSTTVLRTGEVLVASGNKEDKQRNTLPQVFNPATGTYRDLTGAVRAQPLYPWHYVLPDGHVLDAGPDEKTWRLSNVSGVGAWAQVETTNHGLMREAGTSVMYAPGKILIVGGSRVKQEAPTDTAEIINMNAASPTWQYTGSLVGGARRHLDGTILADGTVLVSGGSSSPDNNAAGAIRAAEIWDPQTGLWSVMASMNVPRLYHSSAGLLPDGRVVHAGGGLAPATGDVNHQDAEFFKPPYLFKGPRPQITGAPSNVDYNQMFFVETPDAANIARVTWVRLSSTTHSFNQNQRFNELAFSQTGGGLTVTAPANSNLSPPGHYMLFILNAEDVPSVAAIIQIDVNPSAAPVAEFSGTPTSGTAPLTVSFSDSSTNSPTAWAWDFNGDAITDSTAQNPSFVYNTAGTYTVTLTASNAAGSDAEVKTGYITVSAGGGNVTHQETQSGVSSGLTTVTSASLTGVNGHLYLAAIAATSNKAVSSISGLGLSWSLVRSQCSARGGIPRIEVWRAQGTPSGNGTVTATFLSAPSHAVIAVSRYSGAGSIGAIVSGNTNGVNGACSGGVDSGAYSFDLSTTVPGAVVYGAVSMRNRPHTPGAGYIERVERAQGSGGTVASVAVEDRTVASASTVVVNGTLGGIIDWGVIGLEIKPVSAGVAPVAEFSGTPTSGTAPLTVSFSDSSTNSPTAWAWDFNGDAITDSTAQNPPSFVYNTAGTYTVTLTASNAAGSDAEVKTGYITVSAGGGNVTHQETQSGVSSGLTTVSSASLNGVNGHLYLAAIAATSSKAVSSISGLGLSWSLVRSQCSARGGIPRIEVWRAQGTPSGNGTVTATFLTAPTHAVIAVSRYSGAGSIGAIVSGNTNGVNGACSGGVDSGAYSFDLSTTVPGAVVYGAVSMRNRPHTPGAGYIERVERAQGSGGTVASVAVEDRTVASASTVVVNGTLGGIIDWGVIGLEIKP